MEKEKIERINFLARQSRVRALTEEEKAEQTKLRNEYRAMFRSNLLSELDRVYIQDENGVRHKLTGDNNESDSNRTSG